MRRSLIALLALAALAAGATSAHAARAVRDGVITVGFGAGGIEVGMPRAEVVSLLGRPFYENRNGYMQYMPDDGRGIFDVYRAGGGRGSRVRMISISSFGRHFTVDDGIPIFEAGGLRRADLPHRHACVRARHRHRLLRHETEPRRARHAGLRREDLLNDARGAGLQLSCPSGCAAPRTRRACSCSCS